MSASKNLFCLLFLAAVLVPLWGCGGTGHGAEETYCLVASNIQLPYWQAALAGLARAGRELHVKYEMVGPDVHDPKEQQQAFRKAVQKKPTGILVSPADPGLMKADIDAAIAAGIPVITIDSDAPSSKRLLFIGTDNYEAGLIGGRVAAKQLQGKGNVVVFAIPGQANQEERLRGYRDVFASHPQIKIVETINVKGDPRIAFDTTSEIIEKRKDSVNGFICLEASGGKGVAEVLDRRQVKDKTVVAMDTDAETLEWIDKGVIAATIAQKPFTMAYFGLKVLDDLYHHPLKTLDANWHQDFFSPLPDFVDTGALLIDKGNLKSFSNARDTATAN